MSCFSSHSWTPDVSDRFEQRAKCIIDQYGGYVDESTGKSVSLEFEIIMSTWNLKVYKDIVPGI